MTRRTAGLEATVIPTPRAEPRLAEQRVRGRPRECGDVVRRVSLVVVAVIDAVRAQPSARPGRGTYCMRSIWTAASAMTGCADDAPANMRLAGSRVHDSHVARPAPRGRSGPTNPESPAAQPESSCSPNSGPPLSAQHSRSRRPRRPTSRSQMGEGSSRRSIPIRADWFCGQPPLLRECRALWRSAGG
jgi:hypothetical protein